MAKVEWSCGHVADEVCAECFRLLAAKAHELQMEVDRLSDQVDDMRNMIRDGTEKLRQQQG
jgi:hypothetical protein